MSTISDNLIHFLARQEKDSPTKQFEVLKLIFKDGLRTGPVLIKFRHGSAVHNHIVCFTDIPLRECNEHTSIYGKFGIGFKKAYVKNSGGNPARYFVDYIPGNNTLTPKAEVRGSLYLYMCKQVDFLAKLKEYNRLNPTSPLYDKEGKEVFSAEDIGNQVVSEMFNLSHDKEMGDLGSVRDETKEIDLFYKEREWRLVPPPHAIISGDMKKDISNCYNYLFNREDVNMIVVPNEEMRTTVLEYFRSLQDSPDQRLKSFGDNQLPVINYDDLHRW